MFGYIRLDDAEADMAAAVANGYAAKMRQAEERDAFYECVIYQWYWVDTDAPDSVMVNHDAQ